MLELIKELRRRNMFRVAGVYAVTCWLLTQVAQALESAIGLPDWFDGMVVALMILGFPITMVMAWAFELTPDGIKRTANIKPDESNAKKTGRILDYAILAGLVVVAGLMGLRGMQSATGIATAEGTQALRAMPSDASIAVLPFMDLSADGDQEYFADGVSEEILNVLAQVGEMRVAGRTSSFAFKGRQEDLREIGRVLGVSYILEGSVRKSGDMVRITAQLIEADNGFHLWSRTYDRDLSNIFATQDEIAVSILQALRGQMAGTLPEGTGLTTAPASARADVDAYALYLRAKPMIASRTTAALEDAETILDEAIAIDPAYAPALSARAMVEMLLSDAPGSYGTKPVGEAMANATLMVEKALELAPDLADAHAVRGLIYLDEAESEKAIIALRRAIDINPNHLDARNWLSFALASDGRFRDVADAQWELFQIDPLYKPAATNAIQYLDAIGDLDRAARIIERVKEISPDSIDTQWAEAVFHVMTGEAAKALTIGDKVYDEAADANRADTLIDLWIDIGQPSTAHRYNFEPAEPFILIAEGRTEQALAKARTLYEAAPDYPQSQIDYIRVLAELERWDELYDLYKINFRNVVEFDQQLYSAFSSVMAPHDAIVQASRAVGDERTATESMRRWRSAIDIARARGVQSSYMDLQDASWHMLDGDLETAIDFIEKACARASMTGVSTMGRFRQNEQLAALPRFRTLYAEEIGRVNAQRDALGLPPLPVES
jgi:TolB-like protein/tetratricopeptide (TPR) repeat protein